ncbi:MAG: OmpA family protein [Pseudomonadota bacterium]
MKILSNDINALLLFSLFCVSIASVQADYRYYEADVAQSRWKLIGNSVLCRLEHDIPMYGRAIFTSEANRLQNLKFEMNVRRELPREEGVVELRSQAPAWRSGIPSKDLGKLFSTFGRTPIHVKEQRAWRILGELEQGMFPTFYHKGWMDGKDQVAVGVSSVNFLSAYKAFQNCVSDLLPYSFEDIANSVLHFDFDKHDLNKKALARMQKITTYLQASPELKIAIIYGHTDSRGGRWYNKKLGERRANTVKNFLVDAGVATEKVKIFSHGERKPVASNRTDKGRAMNRRVILQLKRE